MKMKDISTAPKDGTEILLWGAYDYTIGKVKCGFIESRWYAPEWDGDDEGWETPVGVGYGEFTHWCERPDTTGLPASLELK